jgi:hypothetical protein
MYKPLNLLRKFSTVGLLSLSLISCTRENIIENIAVGSMVDETPMEGSGEFSTNTNAPAAHIAASEKLILPASVELPANLPNGNTRVTTYYAVGVQKYKAREKAGSYPLAYEWVFVAPQAELYDVNNARVGSHGAGPFWELSSADNIFAQHFTPAKTAPSADAESIDWLLLMPKTGTTPTGIFADVDYIQRIATKGGKAPATPPASAADIIEVKYKAVYRFTKMNDTEGN